MLEQQERQSLNRLIGQMTADEKRELRDALHASLDDSRNGPEAPSNSDIELRNLRREMDAIRHRSKPGPPSITELIVEGRRY